MPLLEAAVEQPHLTIFGPGAPVAAIVVVSLVALAIYALYVLNGKWKHEREHGPLSAASITGQVPRAEQCAGSDEIQRVHSDLAARLQQTHLSLREAKELVGDGNNVLVALNTALGKVETWMAGLQTTFATGMARQEAASTRLADVERKLGELNTVLIEIRATLHAIEGGRTGAGRR